MVQPTDDIERLAGLGRVVATVSHELRNPLAAITNTMFLLRHHGGDNEAIIRQVDRVERELTAANVIVDDLLAYSRDRDPQFSRVALDELVAEVVDVRRPALDITVQTHGLADNEVVGDRGMLRQLLLNLFGNALDAIGEGPGTVSFLADRGAGGVVLRIVDTGHGIDDEVADRLFEPFVTSKPSGIGLGLAVVRRIAEAHGGTVDASGSPDGSTFTVTLPHRESS